LGSSLYTTNVQGMEHIKTLKLFRNYLLKE
jgi:hypothetical protein